MLVYVNAYPLNRPEVMVSSAADKFRDGELVDAHTRQKVREQLVALAAWAKRPGLMRRYRRRSPE
ncbi:MAG: hypothetical protein Q8L71_07850 [Thiobacillus sp.]|nr:hypothetical protein [Thiobacillus sp.]